MLKFTLLTLFLVLSANAGILPRRFLRSEGRIVGGQDAIPNQFPHQVSLRDAKNEHFCGGSVIHARWVVTAAHCLVGAPAEKVGVVVGALNRVVGGVPHRVSKIVNHPDYDKTDQSENDISVVQTATAIAMTPSVMIIGMASQFVDAGVTARASGWGLLKFPGGVDADTLQWVDLVTIKNSDCTTKHREIDPNTLIPDSAICTKGGRIGTCDGDSGGPLISNNLLIGVVSWGIPCAQGYPDVFARLDNLRPWVIKTIGA